MEPSRKVRWTGSGFRVAEFNSVRFLRESDIWIAFQPIVSLMDGSTFAHEALTRCTIERFASPQDLFDQAAAEGACGRLGRMSRNVLFEKYPDIPVFLNLHPQEISQRWLVQPTDPLYLHNSRVYLEVTEAAAFEHLDICMSVLGEVRSRCGACIVVDDYGAGHSDLTRVLTLKPDLVKLDMALVRGLDTHPERQPHVRSIIELCHSLGSTVVVEGIETLGELNVTIALGADYGQGYLFGKPVAPPRPGVWPRVPDR